MNKKFCYEINTYYIQMYRGYSIEIFFKIIKQWALAIERLTLKIDMTNAINLNKKSIIMYSCNMYKCSVKQLMCWLLVAYNFFISALR